MNNDYLNNQFCLLIIKINIIHFKDVKMYNKMFGRLFTLFICLSGAVGSLFELDGNAVRDTSSGVDWDDLYLGNTNGIYSGVISDPSPQTIFATGRSKDTNDVSVWKHTDGSVPDKDDITNTYAYARPNDGELTIYFGADRYSNDGDASTGFWFFQDNVQALPGGTFSGTHKNGDLLVIANFGSSEEVLIYEWVDGNLVQFVTGQEDNDATCDVALNQTACAIPNAAAESSPWPYQPKDGNLNEFPSFSFLEGNINLNAVFSERNIPCFTTFLAVTRSSSSLNAQLKDFVVGQFEVCDINVNINCTNAMLNNDTQSITYNFDVTIENNGFGQLYNVEVYYNGELIGQFTSLSVGEMQTLNGHFVSDILNTTTSVVTVYADPSSESNPGDRLVDTSDVSQCPVLTPYSAVDVNKTCNVYLTTYGNHLVVEVSFRGYVCNTGDIVLNKVEIVDDRGTPDVGDDMVQFSTHPLEVGDCLSYEGRYRPSFDHTNFIDNVHVTGDLPFGLSAVHASANAQCQLCP